MKSKQPNATAYRKRRRKFADKKSGRKRARKLDKPQKEKNSDTDTGKTDDNTWGTAHDGMFIKDIKNKTRNLLSLDKEKENIAIHSTGEKKSFSECYETSDMDSSFGSEHKRREEKREKERAKFNDAKILRFEDLYPDLHQPKVTE
jgi:hypothetical protein